MSSTDAPAVESPEDWRELGEHYSTRALDPEDETWLEDAIEDYLGITVTDAQREICRAVVTNEKVLVQTANGIGKSYILACITLAWLTAYYPAAVLATSGTYPKLKRTFCKPVESLHGDALDGIGLPGEYKRSPPRIEIDGEPNQYFEAASPKDAGELEGVHGGHVLGIIEEADKDDVSEATFESMESLVSDQRDRIVAIANPPRDETNSLQDLYDDPTWHVVRLSSFDSHNVAVETGVADGELIDGLATLWKIKQDWESYVGEEWPGIETARMAHVHRDDLDARWYRRRAGVIPPASAGVHRPLDPGLVEQAYDPNATPARETPTHLGVDVARSGDDTVAVGTHAEHLVTEYAHRGTNHTEQEQALAELLRDWPPVEVAVDAVGEGSGLADGLDSRFPEVTRYKSGATATDETAYDRCWGESLALFAEFLAEGGSFSDSNLYEQAKVAARTVTWEEKHLASRGQGGADVLRATPKDEIRDRLGRSPDHLDAALQAVWLRDTEHDSGDSFMLGY